MIEYWRMNLQDLSWVEINQRSIPPWVIEAARQLDPELRILELVGTGAFGIVTKVKRDERVFALKTHYPFRDQTVHHEFAVQKALEGIVGIPKAIKLYSEKCFLMDYINGKSLMSAGDQSPEFFMGLERIAKEVHARGYSLPRDLTKSNVIVDGDKNPWIVDFMLSDELDEESFLRDNRKIRLLKEDHCIW